ncbi:MAG: tetratricopeptide repeat protein [Bacteroidota bacterium]
MIHLIQYKLIKISILSLLIYTIYIPFSFSQNSNIDSLELSLNKGKIDTNKIKALNQLFLHYEFTDTTKASMYLNKAIILSKSLNFKKGLALSYLHLGFLKEDFGDYNNALLYYNKSKNEYKNINDEFGIATTSVSIANVYKTKSMFNEAFINYKSAHDYFLKTKNEKGLATIYNNYGIVYDAMGNYKKATENYIKAIYLYDKINFKLGLAATYCNLGVIFQTQKNYPLAISYFNKSIKICQEIGHKNYEGNNYNNLGDIYEAESNFEKSLYYHFKALKIREEIGDKFGIGSTLCNIGGIYANMDSVKKALTYLNKAEKIYLELDSKKFIVKTILRKASLQIKTNQLNEATKYINDAITISKEIGANAELTRAYYIASELYEKIGNTSKALMYSKMYITNQDSVFSAENQKTIAELEKKYQSEKKDNEIKILNQENILKEKEIERSNLIKKTLLTGVILVLLLLAVSVNAYLSKKKSNKLITLQKTEVEKAKDIIENQKHLVEEKNKEILDSIVYAKRLQEAILPPQKLVKQYLENSFILYKPKDIVAGDFYWLEAKNDLVLFAAADCTGHGVPGAMVSVVCSNALNRTVKEFGITEPGKILDKVKELVLETFEKSESEVKDGMDVSLCALNLSSKKLLWSGANNPLWLIRNKELIEYAPDKQPIGKTDKEKNFITHEIELQNNDSIYIFTDGYVDQFGGEKGKKLKSTNLKKLLLSINNENMSSQRDKINQEFENWKGDLEQVDDVCVIGVRV